MILDFFNSCGNTPLSIDMFIKNVRGGDNSAQHNFKTFDDISSNRNELEDFKLLIIFFTSSVFVCRKYIEFGISLLDDFLLKLVSSQLLHLPIFMKKLLNSVAIKVGSVRICPLESLILKSFCKLG